jgi:hypothetical protein
MNNASAARVKLRSCATRWNARSWREENSIVERLSTNDDNYQLPIDYQFTVKQITSQAIKADEKETEYESF